VRIGSTHTKKISGNPYNESPHYKAQQIILFGTALAEERDFTQTAFPFFKKLPGPSQMLVIRLNVILAQLTADKA
jgi:hypothetical protein